MTAIQWVWSGIGFWILASIITVIVFNWIKKHYPPKD